MKVAVLGGTGFLGRYIVQRLSSSGLDVSVVGRDPAKAVRIFGSKVRVGRGDITQPETIPDAIRGAEVVVNCVQFPNHPMEVPRRHLTYERYDRRGTLDLIAAAEEVEVRRIVYMSGAGADPASDKSWLRAKGLAERALAASGLDHSILRPSWAYGKGDKALNRFILAARLGPVVPIFGPEDMKIQPVYAGDIAAAIERMVTLEEAGGRTFEIGSAQVMTMREVIGTMLEVMGKKRAVLRIPTSIAQLATAPFVLLPKPPMTPQGMEFATQDGLVDIGPTREILGIDPLPLREGLRRHLSDL